MSHLVIDIGTSSLRAVIVHPDATLSHETRRRLPPSSPFPGAVEFDAQLLAQATLEVATETLSGHGPVHSVGIASQRASTVVWDEATGQPVAPGISWQDIRTAGMCLMWNAQGMNLAPNQSATKLAFLLDMYDASRAQAEAGQLLFGTVETWVAWTLSRGDLHVTDATNAAVTGLVEVTPAAGVRWDTSRLRALNIPEAVLPKIVDTSGFIGPLDALPGSPLLASLVGDQQASLVGQACVAPGIAKMTFGTGAMFDMVIGPVAPTTAQRGVHGTFPIVAWREKEQAMWGVEAIMLSAGTCVDWLCEDMGILASAADSEAVASQCNDTGGVVFVPALLGLGTPHWDYGARGTLLGMTRGTGRSEIVRAVLEGVAHRGADLVSAAQQDTGVTVSALRIDGGMSRNAVFVQALADATQLPVEVSPVVEATALGAGFLAGLASGTWKNVADIGTTWKPFLRVEPQQEPRSTTDRDRWRAAVSRSGEWLPDLSALRF
jgi:glycerol kinase